MVVRSDPGATCGSQRSSSATNRIATQRGKQAAALVAPMPGRWAAQQAAHQPKCRRRDNPTSHSALPPTGSVFQLLLRIRRFMLSRSVTAAWSRRKMLALHQEKEIGWVGEVLHAFWVAHGPLVSCQRCWHCTKGKRGAQVRVGGRAG